MLLFCVESKSERILVEQVVEESLVVSGFDNCGTGPEPEMSTKASRGLCIKPLPCLL
jgi:hypothetical protein